MVWRDGSANLVVKVVSGVAAGAAAAAVAAKGVAADGARAVPRNLAATAAVGRVPRWRRHNKHAHLNGPFRVEGLKTHMDTCIVHGCAYECKWMCVDCCHHV